MHSNQLNLCLSVTSLDHEAMKSTVNTPKVLSRETASERARIRVSTGEKETLTVQYRTRTVPYGIVW